MASHSGLQHLVPGVFGVTVFFFVSGFLITSLLIRELESSGGIDLRKFYMRRLLRLYPPLVVFVTVSALFSVLIGQQTHWLGILAAFAYLTNYFHIFEPELLKGIGGQLWSLAVEQHFYMLFPLLLIALWPRWLLILPVLLSLCGLSLAIRTGIALCCSDFSIDYTGMATESRVDAMLFGGATALAVRNYGQAFIDRSTEPYIVAMACAAIFATLVIRDDLFRQTIRYTIQQAALVPIILAVTLSDRYGSVREALNSMPAVWIGKLSYSLYLWHLTGLSIGHLALSGDGTLHFGAIAFGWSATFSLAICSYHFVETPFFALRRRFGSNVHEVRHADP
jgi:peptidoglycan/LPS O-acetylase OafA/YrhL